MCVLIAPPQSGGGACPLKAGAGGASSPPDRRRRQWHGRAPAGSLGRAREPQGRRGRRARARCISHKGAAVEAATLTRSNYNAGAARTMGKGSRTATRRAQAQEPPRLQKWANKEYAKAHNIRSTPSPSAARRTPRVSCPRRSASRPSSPTAIRKCVRAVHQERQRSPPSCRATAAPTTSTERLCPRRFTAAPRRRHPRRALQDRQGRRRPLLASRRCRDAVVPASRPSTQFARSPPRTGRVPKPVIDVAVWAYPTSRGCRVKKHAMLRLSPEPPGSRVSTR